MAAFSRRIFIHRLIRGSLTGLAMIGGLACSSSEQQAQQSRDSDTPPTDCKDLSGLTETDLAVRKGFAYAESSPYPDMRCDNCQSWINPREGSPCGKCLLFRGPVEPTGYCTYWNPQV